jgi:predicted Zn-dependent peptidase
VSTVIWDGSGEGTEGLARRTVLPNGLRVLTEQVPGVRSVAFGVWVDIGSRDEDVAAAGASHYLEHLLFKGTARRDALEISASLEAVGGEANAFTAKENTCYYARVLDRDLSLAVDVVCDMVTGSLLRGEDIDSERGVILEEIAMHDDDPGDVVHDLFADLVLGDTPLGRPILGTVASIEGMSRETLLAHYGRYTPSGMVVSVAGSCDHDDVVELVAQAFGRDGTGSPDPLRTDARAEIEHGGRVAVTSRPTEQANLVLGGPAISRRDDRRFALEVLSAALGGGMSSRLFQEVREKRGLAYSVYSFTSPYADTGLFGVYAGCQPKRVDDVLEICHEQLDLVVSGGLTDEEIARGKGQLTGGLLLGLEDTGSRMSRLGKGELVYGEHLSAAELIAKIEAVTADDIAQVASEVLAAPRSLAVIGPVDGERLTRSVA